MNKAERELLLAVAHEVAELIHSFGRGQENKGGYDEGGETHEKGLDIELKMEAVKKEEDAAQLRFEKQAEGRGR
jgi:hypothetical protein